MGNWPTSFKCFLSSCIQFCIPLLIVLNYAKMNIFDEALNNMFPITDQPTYIVEILKQADRPAQAGIGAG